MSGPKSFSNEPRFSTRMFDGMLQQAFAYQHKIKQLVKRLEQQAVSDEALHIYFDCTSELQACEAQIRAVQKPLEIKQKGRISEERYEELNAQVEQKLWELEEQVAELEQMEADFKAKEETYKEYAAYRNFCTASIAQFESLRQHILQDYQGRLEMVMPELYEEVRQRLQKLTLQVSVPAFDAYTFGQAQKLRSDLLLQINQKEDAIHALRMEVSKKASEVFKDQVIAVSFAADSISTASSEAVETLRKSIQQRLLDCPDARQRELFSKTLEQLTRSVTMNTPFAYEQLHDDILAFEGQFKFKAQIRDYLQALNMMDVHPLSAGERSALVNLAIQLLEAQKIRTNTLLDFEARYNTLVQQNQQYLEDDDMQARERLFLKMQLVKQFEAMGYKTMDDMQVIDFEQKDNYLLKTRVGNSYLNLMFRPDGSFRYVFKVLEDRQTLSPDQQQQKLHDMSVACDDLTLILKDLEDMGLKINLNEAKEIHPDAIISLNETEKQIARTFLDRTATSRGEAQVKHKYLD